MQKGVSESGRSASQARESRVCASCMPSWAETEPLPASHFVPLCLLSLPVPCFAYAQTGESVSNQQTRAKSLVRAEQCRRRFCGQMRQMVPG